MLYEVITIARCNSELQGNGEIVHQRLPDHEVQLLPVVVVRRLVLPGIVVKRIERGPVRITSYNVCYTKLLRATYIYCENAVCKVFQH